MLSLMRATAILFDPKSHKHTVTERKIIWHHQVAKSIHCAHEKILSDWSKILTVFFKKILLAACRTVED